MKIAAIPRQANGKSLINTPEELLIPYTVRGPTVVHTITQPGQSLLITSVPQIAFAQGRASAPPLQPSPLCGMQQPTILRYTSPFASDPGLSGKRHVIFCGKQVESPTQN
jgi:hypothetical protein